MASVEESKSFEQISIFIGIISMFLSVLLAIACMKLEFPLYAAIIVGLASFIAFQVIKIQYDYSRIIRKQEEQIPEQKITPFQPDWSPNGCEELWVNFKDEYIAWNATWNYELGSDDTIGRKMLEIHKDRLLDRGLRKLVYLIIVNTPEDCYFNREHQFRTSKGDFLSFVNKLVKAYPETAKHLNKYDIYFIEYEFWKSLITFFIGKKGGKRQVNLFINEKPFVDEADYHIIALKFLDNDLINNFLVTYRKEIRVEPGGTVHKLYYDKEKKVVKIRGDTL